tara:strand:+ start:510 stop:827 length:318 start_codon:yes stop_codon:yes gene_type:complete
MRLLIFFLGLLLIFLQWRLWFSDGGLRERNFLKRQIVEHTENNQVLEKRNTLLEREVEDLKKGEEVIERRAREDLGLIKSDEIFYQFVDPIRVIEQESTATRDMK